MYTLKTSCKQTYIVAHDTVKLLALTDGALLN